ncbi:MULTISPECIES: hypothetical protein [unclassified Pseudonocardia]|uniref:hypothetical protein n=1 Tax=unclassified Pseudonocardia TaxID=2619320 RepID=UPI0006CB05E0|nr:MULTISPECIES: hypothetical protein [unclassified Pseudonocardia]ALE75568.1 hypothetical protein FRP1_26630 [Pseudonocardia sp. EC080625-04]ALL74944.1 hypothetical protein AD006_05815 [Pseudonocardia sp. EC080610-09]ALL81966.1 hypothetical protein AD017_13635 [Pseudonocardia sp. EC080619-01]OLM21445.1 hypothetical protein Ae707Ps1_5704c [Pseudonocardia sp. Ae707_Ps1]
MYEFEDVPGCGGLEASIRARRADRDGWPFPGRHESHAEIHDETPIFHALTVGGWRDRGPTGNAVRRVHRATVRTTRRDASRTADTMAAFHADPLAAPVPAQAEAPDRQAANAPGDAAMAMLRRRRDARRAADRAAVVDLLGGAGRHRTARSA